MTDDQTARVTQLWPLSLRDQAKELVGARGLTAFTLEAVRNHLRTLGHEPADTPAAPGAPVTEEAGERVEEARVPKPLPAAIQEQVQRATPPAAAEIAPEPTVAPEPEAEGDTSEVRGVALEVPTVEGGVAQKYSTSSSKIEAMLAQAQALGLTVASAIPTPPPPPIEPPEPESEPEPEPESEVEPEVEPEVEVESTREPEVEVEPEAEAVPESPAPVQTPVPMRNLEDIDVDF